MGASCGSNKSVKNDSIKDPYFDLIMDEQLSKNEYSSKIDELKKNERHSLAIKHINKELFDKLKDLKTKQAKWTLARAINTSCMNSDSQVGCHAGDVESYTLFKEFFYPIIEEYHHGYKCDGSREHVTDMDSTKITTNLEESTREKIVSTRIRVARNLSSFPLNTGGTKETRLEICQLMEQVVAKLPEDLKGKFYRHSDMTKEEHDQLVADHFLFKGKDKMQAASGYHEHWPHGRAVFLSNDKKFIMWINEGDHIRIISMEQGGDIKSVFERLSRAIQAIEKSLQDIQGKKDVFMSDKILGLITCCPSNLGTGMRGSVHILLPKLIKKIGQTDLNDIARSMLCQARGTMGEHSEVVDRIDISNWRRLGQSEYDLVQDMIKCANHLSSEEDKIE